MPELGCNLAETVLELCWNLAETLLKPCCNPLLHSLEGRSLAGTWLKPLVFVPELAACPLFAVPSVFAYCVLLWLLCRAGILGIWLQLYGPILQTCRKLYEERSGFSPAFVPHIDVWGFCF